MTDSLPSVLVRVSSDVRGDANGVLSVVPRWPGRTTQAGLLTLYQDFFIPQTPNYYLTSTTPRPTDHPTRQMSQTRAMLNPSTTFKDEEPTQGKGVPRVSPRRTPRPSKTWLQSRGGRLVVVRPVDARRDAEEARLRLFDPARSTGLATWGASHSAAAPSLLLGWAHPWRQKRQFG